MKQSTNKVLMIRPCAFAFNIETSINNHYQINDNSLKKEEIQRKALIEFNNFTKKLIDEGIDVKIIDDTLEPFTPDSIFPNNWFSTHEENIVVLYPMFAKNRRLERTDKIYKFINKEYKIIDLTFYEKEEKFLEGTGAMVLDRINKKAYSCISDRCNEEVLDDFCEKLNYKKVIFNAYQNYKNEYKRIYHTNVMMGIGEKYAIICLDSIIDLKERKRVISELLDSNKEIINISENQVNNFLGNTLELEGKNGKICVMSKNAYNILEENQKKQIEKYAKIVFVDISTIEKYGGGSARCMIAELFI